MDQTVVTMAAALVAALGILGKLLLDVVTNRRNSRDQQCDPRLGCEPGRAMLDFMRENHAWTKELRDAYAVTDSTGRKAWMCAADLLRPILEDLASVMRDQQKLMSRMMEELKDLRRDLKRKESS